jgi:DNA repair protein RadC
MFDIANNTEFLTAIGINDASEDVKAKLIAGIENLAQERLITKVSDKLTEQQAEEFGKLTDEQQAADWLNKNMPEFPSMVTEVFEEIKNEILTSKAQIVGE